MPKKSFLIFISCVLVFSLSACNKPSGTTKTTGSAEVAKETPATTKNSELRRYGVKSGTIEYDLTGTQSGKKTVSWDDWGMKENTSKETTITAGGMAISSKDVSIMDGEWIYSYDPSTKKGTKIKNTAIAELAKNANNPDLGEIGLDMIKSSGAKKIGTETVAGTTCDTYEVKSLGTKTCVWKALTLKLETNFGGVSLAEVATSLSTSAPDKNLFILPSDVTFDAMPDIRDIKNLMKK